MIFTRRRPAKRGNFAPTILILPSNPEKKVRRFSFHPVLWAGLWIFLIALPLLAGSWLWGLCHFKRINAHTHMLEAENEAFKSSLAENKERIAVLTHELLAIREKAGLIQSFLGLKTDGEPGGKMGQGGIELSPKAFQPGSDIACPDENSPSPGHAPDPDRTNSLLRRMDFKRLNADLAEIISTLKERQDRLDSMPSISPLDPSRVWLSSAYGMRTSPFTGRRQFHPGVDLAGSKGTPILATAKGQVAFVGKKGSLGLLIEIEHDSTFKTSYGHLSKTSVKRGQEVHRGDIIGYLGDTGRTTGYHLHYEVEKNGKRVNPLDYMTDWGQGTPMLAGE